MSGDTVAFVRRLDTREPAAAITPSGAGYGFTPSDEGTDSRPVPVSDRADALWFEDREDYEVEWIEEEAPA